MMRCLIEPSLLHYGLPGYVLVIISFCHLRVSCFCPRPDDHLAKPGLIQKTLFNRGNGLDDSRGNASRPPSRRFYGRIAQVYTKMGCATPGSTHLVSLSRSVRAAALESQSALPIGAPIHLSLLARAHPQTCHGTLVGGLPLSLTE